jgi:hypothetical protein
MWDPYICVAHPTTTIIPARTKAPRGARICHRQRFSPIVLKPTSPHQCAVASGGTVSCATGSIPAAVLGQAGGPDLGGGSGWRHSPKWVPDKDCSPDHPSGGVPFEGLVQRAWGGERDGVLFQACWSRAVCAVLCIPGVR